MGKNKNKLNKAFKVAGAKSLKLKSKAKVQKGQLKNINIKNKSKILEVDKQLVQIQEKVLQIDQKGKDKKTEVKKNTTPLKSHTTEEYTKALQLSQETLKELDSMQLDMK